MRHVELYKSLVENSDDSEITIDDSDGDELYQKNKKRQQTVTQPNLNVSGSNVPISNEEKIKSDKQKQSVHEQIIAALRSAPGFVTVSQDGKIEGETVDHQTLPEFGPEIKGRLHVSLSKSFLESDPKSCYTIVTIKGVHKVTFEALRIVNESTGGKILDITVSPSTGKLVFLIVNTTAPIPQNDSVVFCDVEENMRKRFLMSCAPLREKITANHPLDEINYKIVRMIATSREEMPSNLNFEVNYTYINTAKAAKITFSSPVPTLVYSFLASFYRNLLGYSPTIEIICGSPETQKLIVFVSLPASTARNNIVSRKNPSKRKIFTE